LAKTVHIDPEDRPAWDSRSGHMPRLTRIDVDPRRSTLRFNAVPTDKAEALLRLLAPEPPTDGGGVHVLANVNGQDAYAVRLAVDDDYYQHALWLLTLAASLAGQSAPTCNGYVTRTSVKCADGGVRSHSGDSQKRRTQLDDNVVRVPSLPTSDGDHPVAILLQRRGAARCEADAVVDGRVGRMDP
jgi:hypothetical protein